MLIYFKFFSEFLGLYPIRQYSEFTLTSTCVLYLNYSNRDFVWSWRNWTHLRNTCTLILCNVCSFVLIFFLCAFATVMAETLYTVFQFWFIYCAYDFIRYRFEDTFCCVCSNDGGKYINYIKKKKVIRINPSRYNIGGKYIWKSFCFPILPPKNS